MSDDRDADPVPDSAGDDGDAGEGRDAGDAREGRDAGDATGDAAVDREPTPPVAVLAAGLSPLLSLGSQASGALGLPEPTVLADDVLSLPPEERFPHSVRRYADRFDVPLLDPAALAGDDDPPVEDPLGTAVETVVRNAGRWQGQLLAQLLHDPDDPDPYLALAVLLERLERAAVAAKEGHEAGTHDVEHLLSTALAALARLVALVDGETTVDDATYRDAVRASYHVEVATGGEPRFDPAERTDAACRRIVRLQGALLAFDTFDRPADEVGALTGVEPAAIRAAVGRRDGR